MGAGSSTLTSEWSSDEVAVRVGALGLAFIKYEIVVKEHGVNGETLLALTPQDLSNYEVEKIHRVRLGVELQKLKKQHSVEVVAIEEEELRKRGGPMVDWLKSINVRNAERYARNWWR
jgi:hypothetical protein